MLKSETKYLQSNLADFSRSGIEREIEGTRPDRLQHYRRLIRNIVDGAVSSAYPITKKILSNDEWKNLIDDFLREHNSSEAQVWKYPKQLIYYFESSGYHFRLKKDFLLDLLKFEWMEMEVFSMENQNLEKLKAQNQVTINPYFILEHFEFPVHKKNYLDIGKFKSNYFVLCYRKLSDNNVSYLEFNPLFAVIFENLANGNTPEKALSNSKKLLGINDKINIYDFINNLIQKEIIFR